MASHLKPLAKSDNIGNCFKQTWNSSAAKADTCTSADNVKGQVKSEMPTNAHEFARMWKNSLRSAVDRYDFLQSIGSERLRRIFYAEISFGLLGEIITVLSGNYREQDCRELVTIMETLSSVNRFNLSLQFLDKSERAACMQLLQQLRAADQLSQESAETVEHLLSIYSA